MDAIAEKETNDMTLFLTSSPCLDDVPQGVRLPCVFNSINGFVDNLRAACRDGMRMLIIAGDPDNAPLNDEMAQTFRGCFEYPSIRPSFFALLDTRNEAFAPQLVAGADFIMLAGGHVPSQAAFFERIGLRALMEGFDGVVMGVSAGSMNAASTVYVQPELPGESIDPGFQRFAPGLGLTDLQTLPHYQMVKDNLLDGRRLYEDITFGDSHGHAFYVLVDGSYIMQQRGEACLYGEAYLIRDGAMTMICREGESLPLGRQGNR